MSFSGSTERVWDVKDLAGSTMAFKYLAVLLCDDFRLISALMDLASVEQADQIGRAIVDISEGMRRGPFVVKHLTEGEFQRNNSVSTIFRLQSLSSRTISHYVKKVGGLYLSVVLSELLQRLLKNELSKKLEIDPSKIQSSSSDIDVETIIRENG
eukprot:c11199_g1_i1.p1 GENE.c11199_g1_i1~~c11199_g1_i1.p1  ORF type:complete len:155 (-),score=59.52 c11199_g1_i1:24-488(-)